MKIKEKRLLDMAGELDILAFRAEKAFDEIKEMRGESKAIFGTASAYKSAAYIHLCDTMDALKEAGVKLGEAARHIDQARIKNNIDAEL